jgi:hypothetical protein
MDEYGFANINLPKSYTMENWAPPALDQGNTGTCAGYATAYAAASINLNYQLNLTDDISKLFFSFDPLYFYSLTAVFEKNPCQEGMSIQEAMVFARKYGFKSFYLPPQTGCTNDLNLLKSGISISEAFKPGGYFDLAYYNINANYNKIRWIKKSLNHDNRPVVIGTKCFAIEENPSYAIQLDKVPQNNERWGGEPSNDDGHALCIVGYDDNKYGGSFKLLNSWGADYGDNGFVWMPYADIGNCIKEAMSMDWYMFPESGCLAGDCESNYSLFKTPTGALYNGGYRNGLKHGYGIERSANGQSLYIGPYKDGQRHGEGVAAFKGKLYYVRYNQGEILGDDEFGFAAVMNNDLKVLTEKLSPLMKLNPANELPDEYNK